MLHCHSADPKRQRIYQMKAQGASDDDIVNTFVREEGVVALSSPPSGSLGGLITWLMPGVMLLIGFFVYVRYVRGNQQKPLPISAEENAAMERYRSQLDEGLEDGFPSRPKDIGK
jgi:cytochrome c-type biogenesis protein CcmH/NrfF